MPLETIEDQEEIKQNEPKTKTHGRDLTVGSIPRLLLAFTWPLLLGNLIQAGYIMVNRIWIGQFLGAPALAAVTNTMQVAFILIAVANGLTLGSSILVSQYVGARNWDGVRRVVQSSILMLGALSLVVMVLGEIYTVPLLRAIGVPSEAFALSVHYMRLFMLSFPLTFMAFLTISLLRGVGDSLTPLIFQSAGIVITAILDPLLMLGWLGFPKLGLNGTAYAMLFAQTVTIVGFFIYLKRKNHILSPDWRHLRLHWPTSKITLKIALPAAAQQLLVSLGTAIILLFVNQYHTAAVAGYGAASQIDMVAFFITMSFSMSMATLAGQNIGAQRYERVRQTFWWGLAMSGGLTMLISLIAVSFPSLLMRMFINPHVSPEAFHVGVDYLQIVGFSYVLLAVMFVCVGIINGAGHTLMTTVMTLVALWCIRIPLAYFLSKHVTHNVTGIWYALTLSFGVSMLMSLVYYMSGYWKRAVITHGPAPAAAE